MIETNEKALDAYIIKVVSIRAMLERLLEAADDHFDTHPDNIHWGNVGDVTNIERQLERICNQVFKEELDD